MTARVLHLSFMGMAEPLGRSQVLTYAERLARRGWTMSILSFEKADTPAEQLDAVGARLAAAGIEWTRLTYHRGGGSAGLVQDIAKALAAVLYLDARRGVDLLHCRSYIAGTVGQAARRLRGVPYLFDIRSFWLDEKVEAGVWTEGARYRVGKWLEPKLYRDAAAVVSLTAAATPHFSRLGLGAQPVAVIPTCVDVEAFAAQRAPLDARPPVFGWVGSFGERYLIEPAVEIFSELRRRRPDARLEVLTRSEPSPLLAALDKYGVPRSAVELATVSPEAVAARVGRMSATFSLIKPGFASSASCPTKFAESLAGGCPVVVNPGIGDCAELVARHRLGVVTELAPGSATQAAEALLALLDEGPAVRARCVEVAERDFGVEAGAARYDTLYRQIVGAAGSR
jgi:glycosyltransferase involved in cell wall biosynthesis